MKIRKSLMLAGMLGAGFVTAPSSAQVYVCMYCPAGTYSDGNKSACVQCPAGSYCPTGAVAPTQCPAGNYCPAGVGGPTGCPAGSYCPAGAGGPTGCPAGTYCHAGVAAPTQCTAGNYCPNGKDQVGCPAGNYCPASAGGPTGCPGLKWAPAGSGGCQNCGTNVASCDPTNGNTITCNSGYVKSGNSCIVPSCSAGTYWNGSTCSPCSAGNYCSGGNYGVQTPCPAGMYQPLEGQSVAGVCKVCPDGQYQPNAGAVSCVACNKNIRYTYVNYDYYGDGEWRYDCYDFNNNLNNWNWGNNEVSFGSAALSFYFNYNCPRGSCFSRPNDPSCWQSNTIKFHYRPYDSKSSFNLSCNKTSGRVTTCSSGNCHTL